MTVDGLGTGIVRSANGTTDGQLGDRVLAVATRVLLIGGTKSLAYLRATLDELAKVLPECRRVTLEGCTHEVPENDGYPVFLARALREFLSAP